jgi:hypothetical protein
LNARSAAELAEEIENDVSQSRDRAEALHRVAEAFKDAGDSRADEALTEARVFELYGDDKGEAFKGHFQPIASIAGGATDPPRNFFSSRRLEHLSDRARNTHNPIHAARFADVAWDLGLRDFGLAKLAVEKYLDCLELYKANLWDREFEEAAKRAARLAHMLRNEELSLKVRECLIEHARGFDASEEYEPCLDIAQAFAAAPRLDISDSEKEELLDILTRASAYYREEHPPREGAFGVVEGPREFLVRLAHEARMEIGRRIEAVDTQEERLEINRSRERQGDSRRSESPLAALSLYEQAYSAFRDLHSPADLERVRVKLGEAGVEARADMQAQAVEFEISVPRSAIEDATEHLFHGTIQDTARAIAGAQSLIPSVEQAQTNAEERRTDSIAEALLGTRLHISGGYLARRSSGADEMAEALLADELTLQITTVHAAVRQHLFTKLVADYGMDATSLADYFRRREVFTEENVELLEHGFGHYFSGDHVSALHVLVPRFEAMVRDILNAVGQPTADPASGGAFMLGTLLRDPVFRGAAGEDLARYYEVTLLMSGLGLNLRNGLAHGTMPPEAMHASNTELMLHLLLTLTRFEPYPLDDTSEGEPAGPAHMHENADTIDDGSAEPEGSA